MTTIDAAQMRKMLLDMASRTSDDWLLISPAGDVYKGDAKDLMMVLAPHHPLMQPQSLGNCDGHLLFLTRWRHRWRNHRRCHRLRGHDLGDHLPRAGKSGAGFFGMIAGSDTGQCTTLPDDRIECWKVTK